MSAFDELKKHFEGKTIVRVERPNAAEAIGKFVTSDGKAFILHATELGYWFRDTPASPTDPYDTLNNLMEQYHHQVISAAMTTAYQQEEPPKEGDVSLNPEDAIVTIDGD